MISFLFTKVVQHSSQKDGFQPSTVLARPAHDQDTGPKRKATVTRQWLILQTSIKTACPRNILFLLELPPPPR
jgi:hypothetical protein